MRETKFRAKVVYSREWVYGWPFPSFFGGFRLRDSDVKEYEIDTDTISQYTGVKDKDQTEIYEGDIVEAPTELVFNENIDCVSNKAVVEFVDGSFMLKYVSKDVRCYFHHLWNIGDVVKVIGNIYDNKEMKNEEEL